MQKAGHNESVDCFGYGICAPSGLDIGVVFNRTKRPYRAGVAGAVGTMINFL